MARQTDRERTVTKKEDFIHSSPETGSGVTHHGEATRWSTWVSYLFSKVSKEAEGAGEIEGKSLYYGSCAKEWV